MDESDGELAQAALLCRQNGFEKAAKVLGKHWRDEIMAAKHRGRRGVWVKLAHGGRAFLDKEMVDSAEEYEQ